MSVVPASARFSKHIDENILSPLISRLDSMLIDNPLDTPEPGENTNTDEDLNKIIDMMRYVQEQVLFGKIGKEVPSLVRSFDEVQKYFDNIYESLAGRSLQCNEIWGRLDILRKQIVDIRDAMVKERTPEDESAGDGGGMDPAPAQLTKRMRDILEGEQMAHLRRAVAGMDEALRSCLLSLAAFPEGAHIKRRLLIHWWIGEKLVEGVDDGNNYFDRLLQLKFVRAVNQRQHCKTVHLCAVHPWIRRMLVAVANSSAFMEVDPDGDSGNDFQRTRRACLRNEKATLRGSDVHFHPDLLTIYNVDQRYVKLSANWFVKDTGLLTVQLGQWREFNKSNKASDAKKFHVELIHDEHLNGVGACRNLRYLSLRGISGINAIPDSVGNLRELIVLDLRACYNLQVLSKGITKLRKLQYLDVSECYLLVEMPKGLGDIASLQVLKGFVVASSGRKNACRLNDLVDLKNLCKLSVCIGPKVMDARKDELKTLASLGEKLKSLRITWGVMAPDGFESTGNKFSLPSSLSKLELQCFPSKEFGHLIDEDGLSVLRDLEKLYVTGGELGSLQHLFDGNELKLKFLRLRFLKHLEYSVSKQMCSDYSGLTILDS